MFDINILRTMATIKVTESKVSTQEKKFKILEFVQKADSQDLKLIIMGKKLTLTEGVTSQDVDKQFEDFMLKEEEKYIDSLQEFIPAAVVAGAVGYGIHAMSKCIKHCDDAGMNTLWSAIFGPGTYHLYKRFVPTVKNLVRRQCILSCKVNYYKNQDKNPVELQKWEAKKKQFEAEMKVKVANLKAQGNAAKAAGLETGLKHAAAKKTY